MRGIRTVEDRFQRFLFVLLRSEHRHVSRGEQNARKQRDPPLRNFRHINGGGDTLAIIDQRFSRKKAGDVRVGPDAEMNDIEMRQLAFGDLEVLSDISLIPLRCLLGRQLRPGCGERCESSPAGSRFLPPCGSCSARD